ncbi:hypothetical protein KTD31_02305 [Burkholderia multivorans]|uniref:hypothetical protein n=1 Tax=Burkholderia multivorans TaxID=87883 RepID=UPI001C24E0A6|nr:hypothetical protein [Burkholderia multivorans]MBU9200238.1 hypothetical protein [Burkholderia multivorans]MDN8078635.1 hypothetical protein [Burkholderia multivorans]
MEYIISAIVGMIVTMMVILATAPRRVVLGTFAFGAALLLASVVMKLTGFSYTPKGAPYHFFALTVGAYQAVSAIPALLLWAGDAYVRRIRRKQAGIQIGQRLDTFIK